jgi:hypothetical protein
MRVSFFWMLAGEYECMGVFFVAPAIDGAH